MMGSAENTIFRSSVRRACRVWQAGLLLHLFLRTAGLAVVAFLVYAASDYFFGWETAPRAAIDAVALSCVLIAAGVAVVRIARLKEGHAARRIDLVVGTPRRTVFSAHELNRWIADNNANASDLNRYLVEQSLARANEQLRHVRLGSVFPARQVSSRAKRFGIQLSVLILAAALNPAAAITILKRAVFPFRDIPPYSRYVFAVAPESPEILYGGTEAVNVDIYGAPVRAQVWLMSRSGSSLHRVPCFQESPTRFGQRLEHVVAPLEFCFVTGRARSRWQKVNLRLQPRISLAEITLTPPPYSRLPQRQFFAGSEDLAGLASSRVRLALTSNRPLLDGILTVRSGESGQEETVRGRRIHERTVAFEWQMTRPAELEAVVRDAQGTPSESPLRLRQTIVPDNPPEASIAEPGGFILATPSVTVPFSGTVADDLGLKRVDLARAVLGYRDRIRQLAAGLPSASFDFSESLNLAALGVSPGQTLEFYLEAEDTNPGLSGIAASDITRIRIISDDEYAMYLRAQTSLEEFMRRHITIEEEWGKLTNAVGNTLSVLESQEASRSEKDKAIANLRATASDTARLFGTLADDFPIYDIEKNLAAALRNIAGEARDIASRLGQNLPEQGMMSALRDILREAGTTGGNLQKELSRVKDFELISKVMECAAMFKAVERRQSELVRRLGRFQKQTSGSDIRLLESLGLRQEEIRNAWLEFVSALRARASELPAEYAELNSSAMKFADIAEGLDIPSEMARACGFASNHDGPDTLKSATIALEKLRQLISDCCDGKNAFGNMVECRLTFRIPGDLKTSLEQMLAAIGMGLSLTGAPSDGQSPGMTGQGMAGGDMDSGYAIGAHSPLNMPVLGPARTDFPSSRQRQGAGDGKSGGGIAATVSPKVSERTNVRQDRQIEGENIPFEEIPAKYRDAVRRFFTEEAK